MITLPKTTYDFRIEERRLPVESLSSSGTLQITCVATEIIITRQVGYTLGSIRVEEGLKLSRSFLLNLYHKELGEEHYTRVKAYHTEQLCIDTIRELARARLTTTTTEK